MLRYPLSPVAVLWFARSSPSSNLAGVIACLADECLAPSFRTHPARQAATINNTRGYNSRHLQPPCVDDQSRGTPSSSSRSLGAYCLCTFHWRRRQDAFGTCSRSDFFLSSGKNDFSLLLPAFFGFLLFFMSSLFGDCAREYDGIRRFPSASHGEAALTINKSVSGERRVYGNISR